MNTIELLDKNTIDKIAAGEVVERPASVAKELIENAIDSGANAITVEIKNGGIEFIRITDNGCGIAPDQVRKAFLRHATSKLRSITELSGISSLGFRGEALSSIAAVSMVEVITRAQDCVAGVRYCIEGGLEKSFEEVGAPFGTTFIMRHLFFNTPARAKFLKSPVSEANAVTAYVEQLALSHPDISFKYMVNGSTKLHTSGNGELKDAVYQIYGKDAVRSLIPSDIQMPLVHISGFLGNAESGRGNRGYEIYFVNGRYVRSRILSKAIEEAYQGLLMQHRYPFTILNFEIEKGKVDVNVHPAKLEVRFSEQESVSRQICDGIKQRLHESQSIPQMKLPDRSVHPLKEAMPVEEKPTVQPPVLREPVPVPEPVVQKKEKKPSASVPEPFEYNRRQMRPSVPEMVAEKPKQLSLFEENRITPEKIRNHRVIGQIFDTYFLVESEDKLYVIDQHAAHEKVMYERLMASLEQHKVYSQMLMPSVVLSLTLKESSVLRENLPMFASFGFEIEEFGEREFRITAVPSDLFGVDVRELFIEILDSLDEPAAGEPKLITERVASCACKAAVKGNMRLSQIETEKLIGELFTLKDPYHCPHGRPTMISLSHYELDKKFKRIV